MMNAALPTVLSPAVLPWIPLAVGLLTVLLIALLSPWARAFGLLDVPDQRKRHQGAVPMVGGVAIYLVVGGVLCGLQMSETLRWWLLASGLLVVTGALDDALDLGVRVRFAMQITATLMMIFGGQLWIESLGFSWGWLNQLGWAGAAMTLIAVVGLTNAINMADGIDGLASGYVLVAIGSLTTALLLTTGDVPKSLQLSIFFASVGAFWLVNMSLTPLKRVFLGDAGSLLLGFTLAWILIYYSQDVPNGLLPVAALWCVTVPVFDTLVVIVRRLRHGRSPFSADRKHFHYLLIDLGLSSRAALACILCFSLCVNGLGVLATYQWGSLVGLLLFVAMLCMFAYAMLHPEVERWIAVRIGLLGRTMPSSGSD